MDYYGKQTERFAWVVKALVPDDRTVNLRTDAKVHSVAISHDGNMELVITLYDVPNGDRGDQIPFEYGLRDVNAVEVYPVALPADAVDALNHVRKWGMGLN